MCTELCSPTSAFVEADGSAVHTWDEELLFGQLDELLGSGIARQVEPVGDAVAAAWVKEAQLELQLPAAAQQVQAAAQSLLHSQAWLANSPHAFGQALASRLPSVQFMLRRANDKSGGQPASPPGTAPWTSLHHIFLLAILPGAGEQFVVEPDFAAHFKLAGAGEVYNAVLGALPTPLVASPQQVHALVKKLQALMASEAQQLGRSLAPWRNAAPLLSKFFPARFTDTPVHPLHTPAPFISPTNTQVASAEEEAEPSSPLALSEASSSALTTPSGPSPDSVLPMSPGSLSLRFKPTSLAAAAAAVAVTKPSQADTVVPLAPAVGLPGTVAATRATDGPYTPKQVVVGFNISTSLVHTTRKAAPASSPTPTPAAAEHGAAITPAAAAGSLVVTSANPNTGGTSLVPGLTIPPVVTKQVEAAVALRPLAGLLANVRQEERVQVQPSPTAAPTPTARLPAAYMALLPRCVTVKPCGTHPSAARAAAAIAAGKGRNMYVT